MGPISPLTVFNPFKKSNKATDMTTPENEPTSPTDANGHAAASAEASAAAEPSWEQRYADLEAKHAQLLTEIANIRQLISIARAGLGTAHELRIVFCKEILRQESGKFAEFTNELNPSL
jgi:hypothetical protein